MDDPNMTMEEYIKLEEEKARRRGRGEADFPAIVINDAFAPQDTLRCKSQVNETSLSECDEEEQKVLNFNDLFPFNVVYPNDLKSDKDNDDDKIDIEHSLGDLSVKLLPDVINTDVGAYAHSTVYTAYLLNEYNVYDTCINTVYPGDLVKEMSTNIGGEFTNLEDLEVLDS
ncbi:hypothetical protein Tco_0763337 [Tanacetum coccineum]